MYSHYLGLGVDGQQPLTQHFHFRPAQCLSCRRQLAVDVRGLDDVAIDEGQMGQPRSDESLGAP